MEIGSGEPRTAGTPRQPSLEPKCEAKAEKQVSCRLASIQSVVLVPFLKGMAPVRAMLCRCGRRSVPAVRDSQDDRDRDLRRRGPL